jgi:hypothetical protein
MTWPKRDMFAITLDGRVLLNAHALEEVDVAELVRKKNVFVGVVLRPNEVRKLTERLYDASSEVAAFIVGKRRKKRRRS